MKRIFWLNCLYLFLFVGVPGLFAQGWTDLPNTHLDTVCPPNGFTAAYGGYTMPTGGLMSSECYRVITGWDSGTVDTKRNRLLFMGDGHDGQNDNAVYSIDFQSRSASPATCGGASSCDIYSDGGSYTTPFSGPVITRLNDPSVFISGCPLAPNPDGSPHAMQTYASLIYLPHTDAMFMSGQANQCDAPS